MNAKIWVINLALLGIVAFFGAKTVDVWSQQGDVPEVVLSKPNRKPVVKPISFTRKKMPPERNYDVLVNKYLFSPERKYVEESTIVEEKGGRTAPRILKRIFLYGVVLGKESRMALVSDPDRKRRGRKELWVGVGDNLGDFRVAEIEREKIVLKGNGKKYEISLYDKEKPKRRIAVRKVPKPKVVPLKPKASRSKPSDSRIRNLGKVNKRIVKRPPTIREENKE